MSPTLPVVALNEYMARLLEVVVILTADDGEAYASQIRHLFMDLEDKSHNETRFVLDGAIETILLFIRRGGNNVFDLTVRCFADRDPQLGNLFELRARPRSSPPSLNKTPRLVRL